MPNIIFSDKSKYQHILVVEDNGRKELYLDGVYQTTYPNPSYYETMLLFTKAKDEVVVFGGGDLTGIPLLYYRGHKWKLYEIDEKVVEVSRVFLDMNFSFVAKNIYIEDCFEVFQQNCFETDFLLVDLFEVIDFNKLSPKLKLEKFLKLAKDKVKVGLSMFVGADVKGLVLASFIAKAFEKYFPYTYITTDAYNVFVNLLRKNRVVPMKYGFKVVTFPIQFYMPNIKDFDEGIAFISGVTI